VIRVEEGSRVRRGELVIRLDNAEVVAKVARLGRLEAGMLADTVIVTD
jgi:multidrug efflux pump subunit AcrA (membrane-fusion protein)